MKTYDTENPIAAIRQQRDALSNEISIKLREFTEQTGLRVSEIQVNHWDTFGGTLDYTIDIEVTL